MSPSYSIETFKRDIRNGPRVDGGYPVIFLANDNGCLCWSCCLENARDIIRAIRDGDASGWRVVDVSPYWEGPPLPCDHCGRLIPSAYGDPEGAPCYVPRHEDATVARRPWRSHVYRVDGLPRVRVTWAPGGPVARWYRYSEGIGLSEELAHVNRLMRREGVAPVAALRAAERARYLRMAALTGGHWTR